MSFPYAVQIGITLLFYAAVVIWVGRERFRRRRKR